MATPPSKGTGLNPLTLWRDATCLLRLIEEAVRRFPRYHKYTLGSDLHRQGQWLTRLARERLRASLASALGHCHHASAVNGWRRLWQGQPWLADWFRWNDHAGPALTPGPSPTGSGVPEGYRATTFTKTLTDSKHTRGWG